MTTAKVEGGKNSLRAGEDNSRPTKYQIWHYDEFLFEVDGNTTIEEIERKAWEEHGVGIAHIQIEVVD